MQCNEYVYIYIYECSVTHVTRFNWTKKYGRFSCIVTQAWNVKLKDNTPFQ